MQVHLHKSPPLVTDQLRRLQGLTTGDAKKKIKILYSGWWPKYVKKNSYAVKQFRNARMFTEWKRVRGNYFQNVTDISTVPCRTSLPPPATAVVATNKQLPFDYNQQHPSGNPGSTDV
jgi:hypothetical protein